MKRTLTFLLAATALSLATLASANTVVFYNSGGRPIVNSTLGPWLSLSGGNLLCCCLGTTGDGDGLAIHTELASSITATWDMYDIITMNGAWIEANARGTYNGACNASLGRFRVTKSGPTSYDMTADFSDIGSSTQHIQVFNNDTLKLDVTGHSGPVGSLSVWPRKIGKLPGATECYVACTPPFSTISVAGNAAVIGTEIRVLAEGIPGVIKDKDEFDLHGAGIPSLIITDEQVTPQAPMMNGGLLPVLALLLTGTAVWVLRRRSSSLLA